HRVKATAFSAGSTYETYTDAIVNMKTVYGVSLNVTDEAENSCGHGCKVVPPGSNALVAGATGVLFNVTVHNTGLSPQSVLLSNSDLPTGWQLFYNTQAVQVQPPGYSLPGGALTCSASNPCIVVNPQDTVRVQVGVLAPANAPPGQAATILIFGTVQEDTTKVAQLQLSARVGTYGIQVAMTPDVYYLQPQEPARFLVTVTNTGTVKDNIDLVSALPAAFADLLPDCSRPNAGDKFRACWTSAAECAYDSTIQTASVTAPPDINTCYIEALAPNETRQVQFEVSPPANVAPTKDGPGYTVGVNARSKLAPNAPVTAHVEKLVKILNHVAWDVDGDSALEYAIDGCTKSMDEGCAPDPADGFETFREAACLCGVASRDAPLSQFLDADSKTRLESTGKLTGESYFVDANQDGHADHFLDVDGDGTPDVLWVPDYGGDVNQMRVLRLNFTRDMTGDQLPELFIDLDQDGRWDMVFDLSKGEFVPLLQAFVDEDSIADYVVDKNRNGQIDPGENVLLGGPAGTVKGVIYNYDMNGDGVFDHAFDLVDDVNHPGVPEYFIDGTCNPTQKACASIRIKPNDVTGDGTEDWTYDHTGKNGHEDSYFDPTCDASLGKPCSGLIDTQAQFVRDLSKYWIVLVLFGIAALLFFALLFVTRRR
ncbi:MAG: hypothetical protein ABR562_08340, partial [Thermoplasmatota archaeon]